MDPQQRLLLELAVHSLEDAAIASDRLREMRVGVFVGMAGSQYLRSGSHPDALASIDAYASTGNMLSMAAGRISFTLGVQGPSLTLDTGCSSSLVALHLACQALRQGECDMALAGGGTVMTSGSGGPQRRSCALDNEKREIPREKLQGCKSARAPWRRQGGMAQIGFR